MITLTVPTALKTVIWPEESTGTTTRFATVPPAAQLREEVPGSASDPGYTARKLAADVLVTVRLSTAAATPPEGMPPAPATWMSSVDPGPRVSPALGYPLPGLVSVMRWGARGTYSPPVATPARK